jgi:hypothetical protein
MAAGKSKSRSAKSSVEESPVKVAEPSSGNAYVGQWNHLVSTTNWEKGRIICEWREALMADGAAAGAYSDEAWASLVGGVTSQHVGRLRRVYQRFGESFEKFEGLYWSHFQAGLEWDDAEMWLEGALQNDWSVSQMRGKRWETLGTPGKPPKVDDAAEASGLFDVAEASSAESEARPAAAAMAASVEVGAAVQDEPAATAKRKEREAAADADDEDDEEAVAAPASKPGKRLKVEVDELPDDLADAFEQFKLAIIAHRRDGWRDTTVEMVLECLDALRELTLAEA